MKWLQLLIILLFSLSVYSQSKILTSSQLSKFHPKFRTQLSNAGTTDRNTTEVVQSAKCIENAVIYTGNPDELIRAGIRVNSRFRNFVTAQVGTKELITMAVLNSVRYVRPSIRMTADNDLSRVETGAQLLHSGYVNSVPYKGSGTIVLIFDTGIDWSHFDFRSSTDTTKSRILYIWDQTITPTGSEQSPDGFTYGVEYTKAQIEDEIDGTPAGFVRERDYDGHGTHVAGTAAGNGQTLGKFGGMAPEADLIIVKGGDGWFSDANMIDGINYAMKKADQLNKPMVVNYSIGSMWGSHDATSPFCVAVDSFSSKPGRVHVNSAGNSGRSYLHRAGTITLGGTESFTITIPSYNRLDGSNTDAFGFIMWLNDPDSLSATFKVTTPGNITYTLQSGESLVPSNSEGSIYLGNYVSPDNGQRCIYLYVIDDDSTKPPASGIWTLAISNVGKTVTYDGWLESTSISGYTITLMGSDVNATVNTNIPMSSILVGSYFTRYSWPSYNSGGGQWGAWTYNYSQGERIGDLSPFSSRGPSRDGRIKPDISAPGQYILSAYSADSWMNDWGTYHKQKYVAMQGTSMAAPNVTGCVALLLGADPTLTADQVKTYLTTTAVTDTNTGTVPNNKFGNGKVNIFRAVAKLLAPSVSTAQSIYRYDKYGVSLNNYYMNYAVGVDSTHAYAMRFTPKASGRLEGIYAHLRWLGLPSDATLACEIYTNTSGSLAGIPGTKIGNTISIPVSQLDHCSVTFIDFLSSNITVTAGTDYHVVFSLLNATSNDQVDLIIDDGSANADNRSSAKIAGTWYNAGEALSGLTGANLRVRLVVIEPGSTVTGIDKGSSPLPLTFDLKQNYPNPFNPSTVIRYNLPVQSTVVLKIFNLLGQEVRALVQGIEDAGLKAVELDAGDLASGVYFYKLEATGTANAKQSFIQTKKMIVLK